MIKLASLLNEQSIPGLNASLTIPEIAFPSGDYHIPPGDVPALKAAAKGIIDAYNDPKNQNLQTTLTIEAGATASEITPEMVTKYWQKSKQKPKTGAANAADDNQLLVRYRAYAVYKALLKHIVANVKFSTKVGNATRVGTKSFTEWKKIIKYDTKLDSAADRKYAKGSIKVTGDLDQDTDKVKNEITCQFNWASFRQTQVATSPYTWRSPDMTFGADVGEQIQFRSNIVYIPDAYYVKYADQEYFSGFAGLDNYKGYKIGTGTAEGSHTAEMKSLGYIPRTAGPKTRRQFTAELVFLVEEKGLFDSINAQIQNLGGSRITKEQLMPGYSDVLATVNKLKEDFLNFGSHSDGKKQELWREWRAGCTSKMPRQQKGITSTFTNTKRGEPIVFLAFPPLHRTVWNMDGQCGSF